MTSPQIVEYALLSFRGGLALKWGRPKGRKAFFPLDDDGGFNPRSISRSKKVLREQAMQPGTEVQFQPASEVEAGGVGSNA